MSRKDERAAKLDKARSYLEKTGSLSRGSSARRPVTPTRSAQESQAVANFKATRPTTPEASSGGLGATRRLSPARSSMRSVAGKSQAFVRAKKLLDELNQDPDQWPSDLGPCPTTEDEAVLILEWLQWLRDLEEQWPADADAAQDLVQDLSTDHGKGTNALVLVRQGGEGGPWRVHHR